jgi:hypothetical protein
MKKCKVMGGDMKRLIVGLAVLGYFGAAYGATNSTDYANFVLHNAPGVIVAPVCGNDPNPMPKGKQFETEAQVNSLPGVKGGLAAFSQVEAEARASSPRAIEAKERREALNAEVDAYLDGQEQAQASARMAQMAPALAMVEAQQQRQQTQNQLNAIQASASAAEAHAPDSEDAADAAEANSSFNH